MRLRALRCPSCTLGLGKLAVSLCHRRVENVESLEGINRNQDGRSDRGVNELARVPLANRVEQGAFIEVAKLQKVADSIYTASEVVSE